MKWRKRIYNGLLIFTITLLLSIVTIEVAYRFQWFDFYKAELNGLNAKTELLSTKPKILICGDSFTASPESYVKILRDSLPQYSVINAAVPGTGILQHNLYMPGRIKKYEPQIFIYQFYIGNDLFDISHPVNSQQVSLGRKAYWWVSDRLLSISFLNFRFAGIRYKFFDDAGGNYKPKEKTVFSVASYSKREKFNYLAEPDLLENTLYLANGRDKDWQRFLVKFKKMIKGLPNNCSKYFIIIPHQAQLSEKHLEDHRSMGGIFSHSTSSTLSLEHPLYMEINKLCKELGMVMIDPLEAFRKADLLEPQYYANDPHLNKNGHETLSQSILDQLK